LNALTTGDHLIRTLADRQLWPVAGIDITLLMATVIAACVALRLARSALADPRASQETGA
ncbi:hypothetical protein ACXYUI_27785, partial [Klebsiella pneumoniae]